MTLGQLVIHCMGSEEVSCNPTLAALEVRKFGELCFFALRKYFISEKFETDQNELLLEYEDSHYHGKTPFLNFTRENDIFSLHLKNEEEESCEQ